MKFLIDGNNKAIRKGDFVEAGEGEMIWDTYTIAQESDSVTVAQCKKISDANGCEVRASATKDEMIEQISTKLGELEKLPEQNKPTISRVISDVVARCAEDKEASDDSDSFEIEVLTDVIQELRTLDIQFKIKAIGGLVKKEIMARGLVLTSAQRKEAAAKILNEAEFNPTEWAQVEEMREHIAENVQDTTPSQALGLIRRFCKDAEIQLPKRVKEKKLPFREVMVNWLIANSPASEEAISDFLAKHEKDASLGSAKKLAVVIDKAFKAGVESVTEQSEAA